MHDLDRAIIATLGYYGVFGRPLTLVELSERMIPPSRLGGRVLKPSMTAVFERLEVLVSIGTVLQANGLFTLVGSAAEFANMRIEQEKIWAQKWRRMLRKSFWFQVVPFVKSACAGGSLAMGTMSQGSDWDMFVIVRAGRLYTARLGLLMVAWFMRALRRKGDANVSDKFCFNHYMTTESMMSHHRSLYTAHALASLIPIFDRENYWSRFWQANNWVSDYSEMPFKQDYARRSVARSAFLGVVCKVLELFLSSYVGDALEYALKRWQQSRIRRDPVTYEKGGRVIADEREIEFHPRSFETAALAGYNAVLDRYGLGAYIERDSGLT